MKFIFFSFLLFTSLVYSQTNELMCEIHFLPGENSYDLYCSFRVPYSRLVFEKAGKEFTAEYELMIELTDSSGSVIQRHIETKTASVSAFEETNDESSYSEGLLHFSVSGIKIKINVEITDRKSGKELRLPEKEILPAGSGENPFIPPLIIFSNKAKCDDKMMYRLANFEGNIPFSEEPFEIILPVTDTSITEIQAEVSKEDSVYWKGTINKKIQGKINLFDCGSIGVNIQDGSPTVSYFLIDSLSPLLPEGQYSFKVTDHNKRSDLFELTVKWYNRPLSLSDPEFAIEALRFIEDESKTKSLTSGKNSEYRKVLTEYWRKSDPTPGTMFNPLMDEYYRRIDYAAKNFSSLKEDGLASDRGKVFIKFGKPLKIVRSYTGNGQPLETWLYEKNKFIFVDTKGTGEFLLIEG